MSEPVDPVWLKSLQQFLNLTLTPIIPDRTKRFKFLTAEAMPIWIDAFTHETFSAEHNYENLEYAGDIVLKWAFPRYFMRKFPTMTKSEYTILNTNYMDKMFQASLSRKMGLSKHIRVRNIDRILNLDGDLFESFFGALERVGDMIIEGSGCGYCYNMIIYLFGDVTIDTSEETLRGPAKTQVQQIFGRFFRGEDAKPTVLYQDGIYTISLKQNHLDFLAGYGVDITNPVIGQARGDTKVNAEKAAYKQALHTLKSYGIDYDWAEQARNVLDFTAPGIQEYTDAAFDKAQSQGFVTLKFFIPGKTSTNRGAVVQLLGIDAEGKKYVVSSTYTESTNGDYSAGKIDVIRAYVS